jgi:hypothetical protein
LGASPAPAPPHARDHIASQADSNRGSLLLLWLDAAQHRSASKVNELPHSNQTTRRERVFARSCFGFSASNRAVTRGYSAATLPGVTCHTPCRCRRQRKNLQPSNRPPEAPQRHPRASAGPPGATEPSRYLLACAKDAIPFLLCRARTRSQHEDQRQGEGTRPQSRRTPSGTTLRSDCGVSGPTPEKISH